MKKLIGIIIAIISAGFTIFDIVYIPSKEIKAKEKLLKENPEMKQKIRIYDSRSENLFKYDTKKNLLVFLIVGCGPLVGGFVLALVASLIPIPTLSVLFLISIGIWILIYGLRQKSLSRKKLKYIFERKLQQRYGKFTIEPKPFDDMISGKRFEIGSIKKDYIYVYKILKYNCLLTNYYKRQCCRTKRGSWVLVYEKIGNFVEYAYDLEKIGIKDIGKIDLENPILKKIITELNNVKIIHVFLRDKFLVVEKETVLYGYKSQDVEIEVEDVSIFYNRLILPLIRMLNQNK